MALAACGHPADGRAASGPRGNVRPRAVRPARRARRRVASTGVAHGPREGSADGTRRALRDPLPTAAGAAARRGRGRAMTSGTAQPPDVEPGGAVIVQPSASYSITMRVRLPQRPGLFGLVATAIGNTGAILGAIDLVRVE